MISVQSTIRFMNKSDIKFIVYTFWWTLPPTRLLSDELVQDLIRDRIILNEKYAARYIEDQIGNYVRAVNSYSIDEFNSFIDGLLSFIEEHFTQDNRYFISFTVLNYFVIANSFLDKFANEWLLLKLEVLWKQMKLNSKKWSVTESYGENLLWLIEHFKR